MGKNKVKKEIIVDDSDVRFIPIGDSGKNACIIITKKGMLALKQGLSFPIEYLDNGQSRKIVVLSDRAFRLRFGIIKAMDEQISEQGEVKVELSHQEQEAKDIGDQIGNS